MASNSAWPESAPKRSKIKASTSKTAVSSTISSSSDAMRRCSVSPSAFRSLHRQVRKFRDLIQGLAPNQRRQFSPWLPAFRTEGEIGQQRALASPEGGHSFANGQNAELEAAKQAKRPGRQFPILFSRAESSLFIVAPRQFAALFPPEAPFFDGTVSPRSAHP